MIETKPSPSMCCFCGGRRVTSYSAGRAAASGETPVPIVACLDCAVAWQWPLMRSIQASESHYNLRYDGTGGEYHPYFDPENRKSAAAEEFRLLAGFLGECLQGKTLLDIGAGMGFFVEEAIAHGVDAYGVEPSEVGTRTGNARLGSHRLWRGSLEAVPEETLFDIITCWDVIEHVEDPLDLVQQASRRLKRSGWMLLETGNYQSIDRIMAGRDWWAYHPEHRWYLAPPHLERILLQSGLAMPTRISRKPCRARTDGRFDASRKPRVSHFVPLVLRCLRRPWRGRSIFRQHRERMLASAWPWAGESVFVMAARRP